MAAPIHIAALGDVHGEFHSAIRLLRQAERHWGVGIDLVLQVGDLEPHRDWADVATMSAPSKYRKPGDFEDFYRGRARLPWPVIFIGGNHEPWPFLDGLDSAGGAGGAGGEGGEVAPGLRFLGRAGGLEVPTRAGPLRIAGLSGIYVEELYPQRRAALTAAIPARPKGWIGFCAEEVERLAGAGRPDVLLLHEWPAGLVREEDRAWMAGEVDGPEGDKKTLRRTGGEVGNEMGRLLIELLAPGLVLCGHMHLPYRRRIGESAVCCVANVAAGTAAVAMFRWDGAALAEL